MSYLLIVLGIFTVIAVLGFIDACKKDKEISIDEPWL